VVAVCRGSIACPVSAVSEWLAAASIVEGPVFRQVGKGGRLLPRRLSPQNVALIVKAYAKRLGLDPGAFWATAFAPASSRPRPPVGLRCSR
jgi:hypothetical protein